MSQKISKSHMPTTIYKHRIYTKTIHYLYHSLYAQACHCYVLIRVKHVDIDDTRNAMDVDLFF